MFQVHWEFKRADGSSQQTAENLPLNAAVQHAIAAFGQVLTVNAAELQRATLVEIHVKDNEYKVKHTLARFERGGLSE